MEEYKRYMCSTCNNSKCIENIVKYQKKNITIIKCKSYIKPKKNSNEYLSKYINELKLRKIRNDC
jgi:hypothetical protein